MTANCDKLTHVYANYIRFHILAETDLCSQFTPLTRQAEQMYPDLKTFIYDVRCHISFPCGTTYPTSTSFFTASAYLYIRVFPATFCRCHRAASLTLTEFYPVHLGTFKLLSSNSNKAMSTFTSELCPTAHACITALTCGTLQRSALIVWRSDFRV